MTSYGDDFKCEDITFSSLSAASAVVTGKVTGGEVVATTFCMGGITTGFGSSTAYTTAGAATEESRALLAQAATGGPATVDNNNAVLHALIKDLQRIGVLG
tara:strand:+ start:1765 stop:2067 length:303 start_codon:yes stop_codon:yes gene_type:complete